MVETSFKTLKIEMIWRTRFNTRADAHDAIAWYIDGFYNPVRRHSALDYLSPVQFEKRAAKAKCSDDGPNKTLTLTKCDNIYYVKQMASAI
jgi:transposase InsO family protein